MEWLEFIGDTLEIVGGIMIAAAVLAVHDAVKKEHQFDEEVSRSIRKEHIYVFIGVTLLILGFVIKQLGKFAA